ncbi:hypothetical protein J3Q64DRAFT_1763337 [Phycomyces blakesleeanus]|uniref:Ubiquitin carboxyl-terminal hydrolase n=2 Tax=Phycomyces blakesleeanus TaxID=4837 RepID=A0A167KNM6_PHYB8|nr:hypothetical protein PHYBLDRAFT_79336 [Phycomyces blakesleeanus NRRL 1555(-)]OAD68509.1 hypothetical protein PHYBLDRAFT_79336 [Phycomyces blakesleeanus NRRL 1555(-)]|eukprot:XP_018286549.1 hypothetical protein PHYBLDRAFT_79336 [Phycomyces blakesleeanus NRRL 1555(-)]
MASSSNYHLSAIAAVTSIALAASGYALSTSISDSKRRRRRIATKIMKERDGKYIQGLINTGNSCFVNAVLQALATLTCLRSYLAERVDDPAEEPGDAPVTRNEAILRSVAYALYTTVEMLNRPLARPRSALPTDIIEALERKTKGTINRDQQDAHELFQIITSALTAEEEDQYNPRATSLFDPTALRQMTLETEALTNNAMENFETSSMSSIGTMGSMWSSFSVSTVGGHLHPRSRRPRNPFTGLAASKISCMKCSYTAPIRHHTFDNISLTVPQTSSCTLENCLDTYTKVDTLTDFQCRKCVLISTAEALSRELDLQRSQVENGTGSPERIKRLELDIHRLKDAIHFNVEASLKGISLQPPAEMANTTKQTMFANPPKALCLHLSRSVYHPSGNIQKNHCNVKFSEFLNLSPYTTNGFLNTGDPSAALSSHNVSGGSSARLMPSPSRTSRTSLVYLRNMAGGQRFVHGRDGLNVALKSKDEDDQRIIRNALPSMTLPSLRGIQYRLSAVVVHYGGHDSGHFITYRRKKLPTGLDIRSPLETNDSRPPTKFWRCSDQTIEEVDINVVLESEAYMLFYERDV